MEGESERDDVGRAGSSLDHLPFPRVGFTFLHPLFPEGGAVEIARAPLALVVVSSTNQIPTIKEHSTSV